MVSIIVPVYNGEDHLEKCVRSVLGQTYGDLELILVNDGSADGTGVLCDRLAAQDSRVVAIHQKNAGVSAARNTGLDAAKGEYIGFVDADDTIAPDTYERALEVVGHCDIAMWDTVTVWSDGRREPDTIDLLPESCILERKEWSPRLLRYMAGSACRCLYRKELVKDIRFPVGIKLSEDRLFNLQAMGKAEKLAYLKVGFYDRSMRVGSACNSYHEGLFDKNLRAYALAQQYLNQYWGCGYPEVYLRLFVIQGALDDIRQICGKASPYRGAVERWKQIRSMTRRRELAEAFDCCAPVGLQQKLLQKRANLLLMAVAVAFNAKNGGRL